MPVEAINQKIITEAEKEADRISKQADQEVAKIEAELKDKRQTLIKEGDQQLKLSEQQNRDRVKTAAEFEVKNKLEQIKRQSLDEVFQVAKKQLEQLDADTYKQFLKKLLTDLTPSEITQAEAWVPAERQNESEEVFQALNLQFKSIQTRSDLTGGLEIRASRFDIDLTLTTLIRDLQEQIESEVAKDLFS